MKRGLGRFKAKKYIFELSETDIDECCKDNEENSYPHCIACNMIDTNDKILRCVECNNDFCKGCLMRKCCQICNARKEYCN